MDTPKKVTFAGRSFNANFRRVTHKDLPGHITIRRTRTKRRKAKTRKKGYMVKQYRSKKTCQKSS